MAIHNDDMARIFVVGCSRSGTTILQKQLSTHLGYFTLPETQFFVRDLQSTRGRIASLFHLQRALGAAVFEGRSASNARKASEAIRYWIRAIGPITAIRAAVLERCAAGIFMKTLDESAERAGAAGWIEKTPKHFDVIHAIRRLVPGAKFAFIFREGQDVVASIVDRARKYPSSFPIEQQQADYAVDLWNRSIQAAQAQRRYPDICFIDYQAVLEPRAEVVRRVAEYFALRPRETRGETHERNTGRSLLMSARESWKQDALGDIKAPEEKWTHMFSESEKTWIESRLNRAALEEMRTASNFLGLR